MRKRRRGRRRRRGRTKKRRKGKRRGWVGRRERRGKGEEALDYFTLFLSPSSGESKKQGQEEELE